MEEDKQRPTTSLLNDQKVINEHNEETLDMDEATEDAGWLSHWPLLTAFAILVIMLTLEFGFEYQPAFPVNLIIFP